MKICLSKTLLPAGNDTKEVRRKKRRVLRGVLRTRGCDLLEVHGYKFGASLRIPGSTTFSATRDGHPTKVAVKSSADRWIGVSLPAIQWGVLTQVDEVLVVTFANARKRDRLQVYRFQPSILVQAGKKVFEKSGKDDGVQWLPLDDTADVHVNSMAGGSLASQGELVAEAAIEWTHNGELENVPDEHDSTANDPMLNGVAKLTITQAKMGLAASFGVAPDNVKIIIEA